ncbi:hypothetical protein HY745_00400, partial [Candidatus Desantisbacteria bacterium]|nr:hypothetical protein [Candidatus Desantisbacteria bacterium]
MEKEEIKGRGPHKLTINEPIKNTWIESPSDKPREKDIYEFEITAPVNAKISINNDMQGLLTLKTNDKEYKIIDKLYYKNIWSGILDIGSYRILLENSRKNNYLKYELKVETNELMPGLDKTINVPGKFDLNVGKRSLLEIYSDGNIDCKGTLTSYENNDLKIINDDIPDDWNFGISTLLDEGKYKLKITPVGNNKTGNNFTKIIFKELNEKTNNTIANFP